MSQFATIDWISVESFFLFGRLRHFNRPTVRFVGVIQFRFNDIWITWEKDFNQDDL